MLREREFGKSVLAAGHDDDDDDDDDDRYFEIFVYLIDYSNVYNNFFLVHFWCIFEIQNTGK